MKDTHNSDASKDLYYEKYAFYLALANYSNKNNSKSTLFWI